MPTGTSASRPSTPAPTTGAGRTSTSRCSRTWTPPPPAAAPIVTSQIALPEGASREAYLTDGYEQSLSNLESSSIDGDMVFSDGYASQLATVDGDPTRGYTAILVVGV